MVSGEGGGGLSMTPRLREISTANGGLDGRELKGLRAGIFLAPTALARLLWARPADAQPSSFSTIREMNVSRSTSW
jgi:hypothetical protein